MLKIKTYESTYTEHCGKLYYVRNKWTKHFWAFRATYPNFNPSVYTMQTLLIKIRTE